MHMYVYMYPVGGGRPTLETEPASSTVRSHDLACEGGQFVRVFCTKDVNDNLKMRFVKVVASVSFLIRFEHSQNIVIQDWCDSLAEACVSKKSKQSNRTVRFLSSFHAARFGSCCGCCKFEA